MLENSYVPWELCSKFVIAVACLGKPFLPPFYVISGTDKAAPMEQFSQMCIGELILWGTRNAQ